MSVNVSYSFPLKITFGEDSLKMFFVLRNINNFGTFFYVIENLS